MNGNLIFFLFILIVAFGMISLGVSQVHIEEYKFNNVTYENDSLILNAQVDVVNPSFLEIPVNVEYKIFLNNKTIDTFKKSYVFKRQTTTTIEFENIIGSEDLVTLAQEFIVKEKVILRIEGTATAITLIKNKEIPIYYEVDIKDLFMEKANGFIQDKIGQLASFFT